MNSKVSNSEGKVCVVSQPTFLPWLGWFDLVDQADVMVILDDVSFSKQSWQQRNRIRTTRGLEFLSVPIKTAGRLGQRIDECALANSQFVQKIISSLRGNYGRAPWAVEIDDLAALISEAVVGEKLIELNCALIDWIATRLDVKTPMIRASSLSIGGHRGEHVAAICEAMAATKYLSPVGAEDYLMADRAAFDNRNISVSIQVYEHPQYAQCDTPFLPYACSLDLIFNEGPNAPAIMRSGRRPPRPLGIPATFMERLS